MAAPRVRRRGLTQRDRLTLTLMTLGTVLLLTALVLFNGLTPAPTEFGSVAAAAASADSDSDPAPTEAMVQAAGQAGPGAVAPAAAPTSAVPAAPARNAPAADPATAAAATGTASSDTAAAAAATPAEPAPALPARPRAAVAQSVSLPVLGVTASVHPIGSTGGVVDVPEDPAQVGFYTGSVLPGSPTGSTVLVGHVNYGNVPGALIGLTDVHEGDVVQVATIDGRTLEYRITAREVFGKSEGLPADLFVTDGPARLVLITCGGPFDTVAQRYEDNVVVVATPVA